MKIGGFKTINVNILITSVFANTFLKYIEGFSDIKIIEAGISRQRNRNGGGGLKLTANGRENHKNI